MEKFNPSTVLLSALLASAPTMAEATEKSRESGDQTLVDTHADLPALHTPLLGAESFSLGVVNTFRPQLSTLIPLSSVSFEKNEDEMTHQEGPAPLLKEARTKVTYTLNFPSPAQPEEKNNSSSSWFVAGALDVNGSYSDLNVGNSRQGLRGTINQVFGMVGKDPEKGRWSGLGAVGFQGGEILKTLYPPSSSENDQDHPMLQSIIPHIPRAYLGFATPKGRTFTAGLQPFPMGFQGKDDVTATNQTNTMSMAGGTLPYYMLGAKAFLPINDAHALEFAVMKGGEIAEAQIRMPGFLGAYHYNSNGLTLKNNLYFQPRPDSLLTLAEATAGYTWPRANISGLLDLALLKPRDHAIQNWITAGIQGRIQPFSEHPRLNLAARAEVLRDKWGITTGVPDHTTFQFATAIGYNILPHWKLNLEYVLKSGVNVATSPILDQNNFALNPDQHIKQAVILSLLGQFGNIVGR